MKYLKIEWISKSPDSAPSRYGYTGLVSSPSDKRTGLLYFIAGNYIPIYMTDRDMNRIYKSRILSLLVGRAAPISIWGLQPTKKTLVIDGDGWTHIQTIRKISNSKAPQTRKRNRAGSYERSKFPGAHPRTLQWGTNSSSHELFNCHT
jgi:hypothetical protein